MAKSRSDHLYALCRAEAHRSVAQQLEQWVSQARHGFSHFAWEDMQASLHDKKESDHEMITSGQACSKNVAAFAAFDMDRDITVNYKKMLGI